MMGFGKSLTVRYTNAKYPQQIYSCKTYNAFGKNYCTQHRIDYDTLYNHVLRKIRECARAALAWYLKAGKAQLGVGEKRKETAESHQWWKGIAAPVKAAYPKGTDAPALYPWRYAGKFSARAGTPDRWWCHAVVETHFSQTGHAGTIEKTAVPGEAGDPLVY